MNVDMRYTLDMPRRLDNIPLTNAPVNNPRLLKKLDMPTSSLLDLNAYKFRLMTI